MKTQETSETTVERLNELLSLELAAWNRYRVALADIEEQRIRLTLALEKCLMSHRARASRLRELVVDMGGEPSALPHAMPSRVENETVTLAALEHDEANVALMYSAATDEMDEPAQKVVGEELLPEQTRTHERLHQVRALAR